jgi:acetyl-CoA decarbonylase/synthase complex subunit delta
MINVNNKSKLIALNINTDNQPLHKVDCDILAIKFDEDIEKSKEFFKNILPKTDKPLMICGCGKDDTDKILLPELIKIADRVCIISYVTEKTYKDIIPLVIVGGHYVVLKTPIDINLAKELNILCIDMGLDKGKILMNTDIGGLGYGYEYGYSIMEKIRLESEDEYSNLPLISEAGLESLKTKEAKYGGEKRSRMIELAAVSGALGAGANIVVVKNPDNINIIRGLL